MATADLYNNILPVQSVNIAAKTNGTANGTGVDLAGFESAMVHVQVGTRTDGTHACALEESDDNSTFTAVAAGDKQGSFPADVTSNTPIKVGYRGIKRYIRGVIVTSGATTGAVLGIAIVKGSPRKAPK